MEHDAEARAYFLRGNRHMQAAYRRALRDAGVEIPSWAQDRRNAATKAMCTHRDVVTMSGSPTRVAIIQPVPDATDDELNALFK